MSSNKPSCARENLGEIIKQGTLKKLKTMKKKYFVLRKDAGESPACLEYYDNEKKFRANAPPKRVIKLKTCFNINQRKDLKQKNVIGLYYRTGCFSIVLESEKELDEWLHALLTLQLGESCSNGTSNGESQVKPTFEHVWEVTVMERDMGSKIGLLGPHHLCLTDHSLTLVKATDNDNYSTIEFSLQKIRACGHMNAFFYMQVGNDTLTGPGNLWMTTEDANIAETMHATIMGACGKCYIRHFRPRPGTNDGSKSLPMQRWPTHPGLTSVRDKSDNITNRIRTNSEGATHFPHHGRPLSMYNKTHSPPVNPQQQSNQPLLSPVSSIVGCSGDSEESVDDPDWEETSNRTHYPLSVTPEQTIREESSKSTSIFPHMPEDENLNNYIPMDRSTVNTCYHKISPNAVASVNPKSSSPSQGSFGELYSPSSSPLDSHGSHNYLPMSPGEVRLICHSRDSSIAEENYVPMAGGVTGANDDGYVDMHHGNSLRERYHSGCNTSTGSTSSLTSSDNHHTRLSDSLDKVPSYITRDDDHGVRGTRAWSFGSRPSNVGTKTDMGIGECKRERACSWGSKNVSRGVFRAPSIANPPLSSSHSSVEPGEDLMEMDFSKTKHSKHGKQRGRKSVDRGDGGMSPPKRFSVFGRSPPKPSPASPPHPSPCLDRVPETEPGYLDMCPVVAPKHPLKPQAFPNTTFSPPIKPPLLCNKEDYLDMSLKRKTSLVEDNNNTKVVCPDSYVEMSLKKSPPEEESDYMNMSGGTQKDSRFTSPPIRIQGSKSLTNWYGPNTPPSSQLQISGLSEDSQSENQDYMQLQPIQTSDYMELDNSPNLRVMTQGLSALNLESCVDENNGFSDKEVQYASLDLQGCDFVDGRGSAQSPLSYAKIDFVKSGRKLAPH